MPRNAWNDIVGWRTKRLCVDDSSVVSFRGIPSHLASFLPLLRTTGALSHFHHRTRADNKAIGPSLVTFSRVRNTRSVLAWTGQHPHCSTVAKITTSFQHVSMLRSSGCFVMKGICFTFFACLVTTCCSLWVLRFHGRKCLLRIVQSFTFPRLVFYSLCFCQSTCQ